MTTYEEFVRAWHKTSQPLQRISADAVSEFEMTLGIALPADYKVAITEVGLPSIGMNLWEWVDDEEQVEPLGSHTYRYALSDFYDLDLMKEQLDWYRAGMPRDLVPFASDSSGNQLAFSRTEMALTDGWETRVYFWDHDLLDTNIAGTTFDAFLRLYIPD